MTLQVTESTHFLNFGELSSGPGSASYDKTTPHLFQNTSEQGQAGFRHSHSIQAQPKY